MKAGSRSTARTTTVGRAEYALRDVKTLTAKAAAGPAVDAYAARLLDTPLPWTRMRTVYRLLGLTRTYGAGPVDTPCARALELDVVDVVDVAKIARMLEQAGNANRTSRRGWWAGRPVSPATRASSPPSRPRPGR